MEQVDTKNELYNKFINGEKKLNFLDIKNLTSDLLFRIDETISFLTDESILEKDGSQIIKTRNTTNIKVIEELSIQYSYHDIFEDVYMGVFDGEFDECFFSDIETNKEIIKIICSRIEDYFEFKNLLDKDETLTVLDSTFDKEGIMIRYSKNAQRLIEVFKNYFVPDLHIKFPRSEKETLISDQSNKLITINYPETETKIDFNPSLFKDEYSTRLFCYIVDSYHKRKDKELSNIYQWMENNSFIQENKRKEYKDLVKEHGITKQKYNRVHPSTEYNSSKLDPTFNDLKKRFDSEIK